MNPFRSPRVRSVLIGTLIILLGVALSGLLAAEWHANAQRANRDSFDSTATGLVSTLKARIESNIRLTQTIRSIAAMEPRVTETRLLQWYRQLHHGAPVSMDVGVAWIQMVPASSLSSFIRAGEADPTFRALDGHSHVTPPGHRATYCLARASVGGIPRSAYPPLLDYCAPTLPGIGRSPYAALIRTATDTGTMIVTPVLGVGSVSLVAIGQAVYRRGDEIATLGERRAAGMGIIGTTFNGTSLIRSVLAARRSLTVALYHTNAGGSPQLIARAGAHPAGRSPGRSKRAAAGDGWLIEVTGTVNGSISPNVQGGVALGLGLLVTLLVFLLYRVLSRSSKRAWGMVGEKTGELAYRAVHDPLTDLPNRILVLDRAEQILARSRRLDVPVTALFVDIDDFKQINDRYGHQGGDDVLAHVGARLTSVLRDNDTVGRLGGDEFVMLIDSLGLDAAPELVAERILDVLRQPMELAHAEDAIVSVTASVGIATGRPATAEELLQDADLALFKAKSIGRGGYVKFESAMQTAWRDRVDLNMDLAAALEGDQFNLVYQPMLSLEHENVVGLEALLRWQHPTSGMIPPDVFIPIAEDSGLIVPLGHWVLRQACAYGATLHAKGYPLNISVNVSARQLERIEFISEVRAALDGSGLDPEMLTLEITETVLMRKPDATALLLGELKALGVRIAVDDFGTGYSSLAYLRQFPVDSLKIDRTFITGLALSSEARALTHTLIQLGKALGLETLAEGVEQESQVRELQSEGCDLVQGYLFARPLSPDELEMLLKDGSSLKLGFAATRSLTANTG